MNVQIIRCVADGDVRVAVRDENGGPARPLAPPSIGALLERPREEIRKIVEAAGRDQVAEEYRLLPPVDGLTEVWASGVTYRRSSEARQEESEVADVYARVYDAPRPELFMKSVAWRVCGDGEPIGVRTDSKINVPEPELALVCNAAAEIVGVTICNDVSSRSIEGENPLYLPQAKVYSGACALGPGIVPLWEVPDPTDLAVAVAVTRGGEDVWSGRTSTSVMHRRFEDLVEHLYRQASFPQGAVLSTGTGLVPDLDFSLLPDDEVVVEIEQVGRLRNRVRTADADSFGWLTPRPERLPA
jgi:2-dehydro-3-deoxy-D-arabinonate dehydratase